MADLDGVPVASTADASLSLDELLRHLTLCRSLRPLALEAMTDKLVRAAATQAGVTVSDDELQRVADVFRRRHGLTRADQTKQWLRANGLTLEDFEAGLEQGVLAAKFR